MNPSMERFSILLFLLCFFVFHDLALSISLGTLSATNQSIRDGDKIVSARGRFELGFFSPGSSGKRYLGIWYGGISMQTVVWVANREVPLNDLSGVLKLTKKGILVLQNHNGSTIWSSNSSRSAQNPVAELLDTGNLIVKEENESNPENYLWQSFDYPCHVSLSEMKLGRNFITGLNRYLSSWKSPDDPSPGNYTYGFDIGGFPETVLKEGSTVLFRPGPWNGLRFSGAPGMKQNVSFIAGLVLNEKEVYYSYKLLNSSVPSMMVLTPDGSYERQKWVEEVKQWITSVKVMQDPCDNYATCGSNSICKVDDSRFPQCSCLKGFVPKLPENKDIKGQSKGCVRRTPLKCSSDGFVKYSEVKLPDSRQSWFNFSMNLEECKNLCKKNCSCTAYANLDIRNGGSGCLLWFVDLVDIRQFTENGEDIYIRLPASELVNKERTRIGILCILSMAVLILGLALVLYHWRKKCVKNQGLLTSVPEIGSDVKNEKEDLDLPLFDLSAIASATDNFSEANKLGEGGFGSVYKGILKDGQEIAVKRLSKSSSQGLHEFKNEVIHIAKLKHRNLVKLLGCCIQGDEKMLIYEFMPNKSLDFFIFDESRSMSLTWPMRYNIINGIARGLLYLHQDSRQRIIHRDLKAGNILLDNEMNPAISDFGLARSFAEKESAANTKKVVGTYGYMAPEYAIDGLYSIKSDVFSFGVLVLEIVSGKRNRGFCHPDHQLNLLGHAWRLFTAGDALELISSPIRETCNPAEVLRSIHVGLLCVQQSSEDRPNMSNVVLMLGSQGPLPQPKQPGFFTERELVESNSSSTSHKLLSSTDCTTSFLEGR